MLLLKENKVFVPTLLVQLEVVIPVYQYR